MMDKRLLPFNGRVAHTSLQGQIEAETFTDGTVMEVITRTADLLDQPKGSRTCQLLFGEPFRALDESDYSVFGFREADGYVGWMAKPDLGTPPTSPFLQPALRVTVQRAPFLEEPDIKTVSNGAHWYVLPFGSRIRHRPYNDTTKEDALAASGWMMAHQPTSKIPTTRFIRTNHVAPLTTKDPATVAELFLHTPYLWGGDSAFGIDCSGLVQTALTACGIPCPRDSDMQQAAFADIDPATRQRGDLIFWKGHVGMLLDADALIHANAHHMAVAIEPLADAITRISAKEFGDVTGYARP